MAEEKREDLEKQLRDMKCKRSLVVAGGISSIAGGAVPFVYVASELRERGCPMPLAIGAGVACALVPYIICLREAIRYDDKIGQLGGE